MIGKLGCCTIDNIVGDDGDGVDGDVVKCDVDVIVKCEVRRDIAEAAS